MFQHTAARRRLADIHQGIQNLSQFQHTAARRRLGIPLFSLKTPAGFQHTAARRRLGTAASKQPHLRWFQHTAARRRLGTSPKSCGATLWFQHTAARRRLVWAASQIGDHENVSTHSRPKAAGGINPAHDRAVKSFNTQPPEGGWLYRSVSPMLSAGFQHTAARRRLGLA